MNEQNFFQFVEEVFLWEELAGEGLGRVVPGIHFDVAIEAELVELFEVLHLVDVGWVVDLQERTILEHVVACVHDDSVSMLAATLNAIVSDVDKIIKRTLHMEGVALWRCNLPLDFVRFLAGRDDQLHRE